MSGPRPQEVSEDALRWVAHIIGSDSAAQKALDDLARRRALGEDAACYHWSGCAMFFVGPRIAPATVAGREDAVGEDR